MVVYLYVGYMLLFGKVLVIFVWLMGIYFVIEFVVGLWIGLIVVLFDVFYMFLVVGGVLVVIIV